MSLIVPANSWRVNRVPSPLRVIASHVFHLSMSVAGMTFLST